MLHAGANVAQYTLKPNLPNAASFELPLIAARVATACLLGAQRALRRYTEALQRAGLPSLLSYITILSKAHSHILDKAISLSWCIQATAK